MPLGVLLRFGRWEEVLAAPEPPPHLPIARSLRWYARGVAYAARGEAAQAREQQDAFLKAKAALPEEAVFGNNKAADLLAVAEHLLAGEVLYREGKVEEGLAALRAAVKREEQLRYSEPPDWIHPVRHSLGATLLALGRAAEEEQVYREDLARLPDNGWSLLGLTLSLRLQGKETQAADFEARFQKVWADADVKITSSCYCQPGR
jgi:tetratricopeptide (TPR) repeat protein